MTTVFSTNIAAITPSFIEANASGLTFLAICVAGAYSWKKMIEIIKNKNAK